MLTVHMKCCSHCCHDRLVAIAIVLQYGHHYRQGPMALCSNLFIRLPLLATVFPLLAPSMQHSLRSTLIMLVLDRVPLNFTRKKPSSQTAVVQSKLLSLFREPQVALHLQDNRLQGTSFQVPLLVGGAYFRGGWIAASHEAFMSLGRVADCRPLPSSRPVLGAEQQLHF